MFESSANATSFTSEFQTRKNVDFDFVSNMVGRQGNSKSYIIENKGYNYKNDSAAEQDY